jgi:TolA-binding protein
MVGRTRDIPTETIQVIESTDNVPGSSVDSMGEPQGDQHITTSSSLVVEASDDVPASTTMSTSTAMVVEETPTAMQGTNRFNPPSKTTIRERMIAGSRLQREHKVLMDEARKEIDSLRKELASTQKHSYQVQQLLEEDSDAHPSTSRQSSVDQSKKGVVGVTRDTLDHRKGARKGEGYQRQKHFGEPGPQSIYL